MCDKLEKDRINWPTLHVRFKHDRTISTVQTNCFTSFTDDSFIYRGEEGSVLLYNCTSNMTSELLGNSSFVSFTIIFRWSNQYRRDRYLSQVIPPVKCAFCFGNFYKIVRFQPGHNDYGPFINIYLTFYIISSSIKYLYTKLQYEPYILVHVCIYIQHCIIEWICLQNELDMGDYDISEDLKYAMLSYDLKGVSV